jgi:TolB-like protein/DNA-binding winged helix-turn-helix (wHTH) protein
VHRPVRATEPVDRDVLTYGVLVFARPDNHQQALIVAALRRNEMADRYTASASIVFGNESRPFALDLRSRELCTRDGCIAMQAQPFEILRVLLERPGEVVAREELRRRLWADTFVDYEHSLNAAVRRLRVALGDDAARPRFIETIPRVGYRLLANARPGVDVAAVRAAPWSGRLAVLPLRSAGGAADFADGLTEELIVQVGRALRGVAAVVARSSSMLFKEMPRRASEVGEVLGVDYLLEGSVWLDGQRVRVLASLIETADETHVWTDTAESVIEEPLSAQADVAIQLVRSLSRSFTPRCFDLQEQAHKEAQ